MGRKIIHIRYKGALTAYLNNFSIYNVESYDIKYDINNRTILTVKTNKHEKVYSFNTNELLAIKFSERRDDLNE